MIAISSKGVLGHPAQFQVGCGADPVPNSRVCSGLVEKLSMAVGESGNIEEKLILDGPIGARDEPGLFSERLDVSVEIAEPGIEVVVFFDDVIARNFQVV